MTSETKSETQMERSEFPQHVSYLSLSPVNLLWEFISLHGFKTIDSDLLSEVEDTDHPGGVCSEGLFSRLTTEPRVILVNRNHRE